MDVLPVEKVASDKAGTPKGRRLQARSLERRRKILSVARDMITTASRQSVRHVSPGIWQYHPGNGHGRLESCTGILLCIYRKSFSKNFTGISAFLIHPVMLYHGKNQRAPLVFPPREMYSSNPLQ